MNVKEFFADNWEDLGIDPTFEDIIRVVHELIPLYLFDLSMELSTLDLDAMAVGLSQGLKVWIDAKNALDRMIEKMKYV